jgi:4-hydroxybutyrate CoA-transferase
MAAEWKSKYAHKIMSAAEAVSRVRPGETVAVSPYSCTPYALCNALIARAFKDGLRGVRIDHLAGAVAWRQPGIEGAFEQHDNYATAFNRAACHTGDVEYLPIGVWQTERLPHGITTEPDHFFVPVSPPDEYGFCSFGTGVWFSKSTVRGARNVIAEVHNGFIRTGGDNFVHIDELDVLVEGTTPTGNLPIVVPSLEEREQVDVICTLVASELVNDRDTLQLGVGTVSASLGMYLGEKHDLGVQTELITGGVAQLVRDGVVTGRYKSLYPGKVVGSACVALPPEELAIINGNPVFELYDFAHTDDLRLLIQQENFVCVNNALVVDLTGQVSAESLDHRMYTGVGGQQVFMIAGAYSKGGRSISVVPSSSVPSSTGQRISRIVATMERGCVVTVPRTFVDYVVTEYGIATLRGKTLKERAREMVSVSHPDFRPELARQAREMYGA